MKIYDKNSAICTLHSLMGTLDDVNNNTKEVMETFISMANDKDINYFVKTFNEIIKKTSEQFLPIPDEIKKYYSEFFANKMKKIYDKKAKITDNDFKSYCNNLFNAYLRCNILKTSHEKDLAIRNKNMILKIIQDDIKNIYKSTFGKELNENDKIYLQPNTNNDTTITEKPKKKISRNNILLNEW